MSPVKVSPFSFRSRTWSLQSEFKDDNHQIPRSSSLIARRFPSSIKGRGNAQDYIVGTAAADALKNDHRIESHAREALLQKQKQQALRNSGALYGSTTKRFDGKDEKVRLLLLGDSGRPRADVTFRKLAYLSRPVMRMKMQGSKRCSHKTRISGNRCKRICHCMSPLGHAIPS